MLLTSVNVRRLLADKDEHEEDTEDEIDEIFAKYKESMKGGSDSPVKQMMLKLTMFLIYYLETTYHTQYRHYFFYNISQLFSKIRKQS